ncbi:macrophage mannose receptor 1-like isoform X2 [Siniperca chuatsi]|uniref:macrophage mannose receptor 1-like isoform X2 n=1 Tax=Siniperca chuatsi TaxID=119488 RepID=UPI001CE03950|nr:macrophage mannose receptor 1-like isoform X2 [Siniperca chuatsi]
MHKTGLVILLLLALSTLSLGVSREYHYVNLLKTWTEAQTYCREKFVDLATIETVEDWARVGEMMKSADRLAWIGLYQGINSWRWSIDNTYLYGDGNTKFGERFVFVADNYQGKPQCVEIVGGTLNGRLCDVLKNSVCYDEPTNKYIAVTVPMTWLAAQSYCRVKYTDLTSMRNQREKEEIMSVIDQSHWWVDLSRDTWTWSDQRNSLLRMWAYGEPSGGYMEYCACTAVEGWADVNCDRKIPFICSDGETYEGPWDPSEVQIEMEEATKWKNL